MLLRNLPLKAASILIAIVLWFWVLLNVENSIQELQVKVPVVAEGIGEGLALGQKLPKVEVKVRGLRQEMGELDRSLDAYVSCQNLSAGTHNLEVQVPPLQHLTVVGKRPAEMPVVLEDVISKMVEVEAELLGDPREGYELGKSVLSPETVQVTGPRSRVDRVSQARATKDLADVFPDVPVSVGARALDSSGRPVEGVAVSPPKVNLQVRMKLAVVPGTVPVRLRTSGTLNPNFRITSVKIEPSLVTILGAANRVREVSYIETEEFYPRRVAGNFSRTLSLVVPEGVTLLTDRVVTVTGRIVAVAPRTPPPEPEEEAADQPEAEAAGGSEG
jgi:YbbR domain-containing protein